MVQSRKHVHDVKTFSRVQQIITFFDVMGYTRLKLVNEELNYPSYCSTF